MNQITASDANVSGDRLTITANTIGTIGGFDKFSWNKFYISNNLVLSSSGEITGGSNYLFNGNGIITGSVTIGSDVTILGSCIN